MTTEQVQALYKEALESFIRSLGFGIVQGHNDTSFTHQRLHACTFCGRIPRIVPDMYNPGRWITQCHHCAARTVSSANPIQAVRDWNTGRFTADTLATREKLMLENVSDEGVTNVVEAVHKDAVNTLMWCEAHGKLDSPEAQDAAWWINRDKVVQDIVSGDRRRREEAKNQKEGQAE